MNLSTAEDIKQYIAFLNRMRLLVDNWPEEKKQRQSTCFHEIL